MDFKKIKKGMKIRICSNPIMSIKRFGGSSGKEKLASTVQEVHYKYKDRKAITIFYKGYEWTFDSDDIREIDHKPLSCIKPEMFNIKLLSLK